MRVIKRTTRRTIRHLMSMALVASVIIGAGETLADSVPSKPMPAKTPEMVEKGSQIYFRRCSFCHGLLGDGDGPAAKFMDPRPRDFTLGTFKFRTTQSGELPTNEDLFRTVSRGLPGTGMQAFDDATIKNGLTEDQRWQVIAYIMTFAQEFADPELDPVKTGKVIKLPQNRAPFNPETVAKGKAVFERAKCWECHGKLGRGDGQKSFDRKDDWGFPIRIRNVTHPWKIKAGSAVEDIYMRFSTGITGTPMPSFVKALSEEDRWYLANYIKSLQVQVTDHQVLQAAPVEGALPDRADDAAWASAARMDVRLAGQAVAAPRWQNPSVELVTLRALYNDKDIAFLVEWDDPFKDATHDDAKAFNPNDIRKPGAYNSYVAPDEMVQRKLKLYRDSIALQFPVKPPQGTTKPHFLRGNGSNPVQLWHWRADQDVPGKRAVIESIARGWQQVPKAQPDDKQQISGKAVWNQGRWRLVMTRPLITEDRNDVQFVKGRFIPLAVNAWDGSNGEHGLIMSLSSWHYILLKAPVPWTVFLYAVLAVIAAGLLCWWLARREIQANQTMAEG